MEHRLLYRERRRSRERRRRRREELPQGGGEVERSEQGLQEIESKLRELREEQDQRKLESV